MFSFIWGPIFAFVLTYAPVAYGYVVALSQPALVSFSFSCDGSGAGMLAQRIEMDGEFCRPSWLQKDGPAVLEASLYAPETAGYPSTYTGARKQEVAVQSPPDTFGCDTKEDIARYLDNGLAAIEGDCKPMLWADVTAWKVDEPLPSTYCAAVLGSTLEIVEVYQVVVGDEVRFAITDCLDEHMADSALEDIAPTQDRPIILAEANK